MHLGLEDSIIVDLLKMNKMKASFHGFLLCSSAFGNVLGSRWVCLLMESHHTSFRITCVFAQLRIVFSIP